MRARTSAHGTQFGPCTVLDLRALPEDGKGFELEDGWLVERAASSRHNWALRTFARIIEGAAAQAGSQIDADKPIAMAFDPAKLLDF